MADRRECCKVDANLELEGPATISYGRNQLTGERLKLVTSVSKCVKCGARHHLSQAEPVHVGVKGGS